jgi:5'-3' exonuclease
MSKLIDKNDISDQKIAIYSNDRDLCQCIDHNTIMCKKLGKGRNWIIPSETITTGVVEEMYKGVGPRGLALFRSLTGDSSDNIKGYMRFPKKVAEVIANDYVLSNPVPDKEGVLVGTKFLYPIKESPRDIDKKWLKVIQDEPSKLFGNYAIMRLKKYDFDVKKINNVEEASRLVRQYRMSKYASNVKTICGIDIGSSFF